jgi:arginyl-tRNA synthetase
LGDWGLPQGILLWQMQQTYPDLPFFKAGYVAGSCQTVPFNFDELCKLYPAGAEKAKADETVMLACQKLTAAFQDGDAGLRDVMAIVNKLSIGDIKQKTDLFGAYFDTWYGESHMDKYIEPMLADLEKRGITEEIDGAIGVRIAQPDDKFDVPPLILKKSMGGYTYGTTDLATVYQRAEEFDPAQCIIVTDFRQEMHFERFFRAARKAGYGERMQFTHVMYGTINGPDGKPFKTRDGGVPSFDFLLAELFSKARERLHAIELDKKVSADVFEKTAQAIGLAAIRFGDLINHRRSDYSFDLEKFVSFEGKTGPYLQYTTVRLKALLAKAAAQNLSAGALQIDGTQKELAVLLLQFPHTVQMALADYAPNVLADYCFRLAQLANRFYQATPVLAENDKSKQASYLALFDATQKVLTRGLDLLGICVPEQM